MPVDKVKQECQRSSLGSEITSSDIKVESAEENSCTSATQRQMKKRKTFSEEKVESAEGGRSYGSRIGDRF